MEEVLVSQRVENAMKKRLQEIALVDCEDQIAAFAACQEGRTISTAWACRESLRDVKKCTGWWNKPEHLIRFKEGYVQLQNEREELAKKNAVVNNS